jgi:hypothetical protein
MRETVVTYVTGHLGAEYACAKLHTLSNFGKGSSLAEGN